MIRRPTHPGEIIREDYIAPLNISQSSLSRRLGMSRKTLSAIINGRARITVETALRLSRAFRTTPELWLNLQRNYDLWEVEQKQGDWRKVEPLIEG